MQRATVPATSIAVSRLALGGWLHFGERLADPASQALLDAAFAHDVRFFDLADVYGNGRAEEVVGRWLRDRRHARDEVVISSKVFFATSDDPADRGLSRRHVHRAIDRSLGRLGVDHVDLYYCHREDPDVPLAETVQAMGDLVVAGKVRAWGTSFWQPATLRRAHELAAELGVPGPRVEQCSYNLIERWIEREVVPCARELEMGLTVFAPLAGGVLAGRYVDGIPDGSRASVDGLARAHRTRRAARAVADYVAFCRKRGWSPAAVAIAWAMARPGVTSVICGASGVAQLEANVAALDIELGEEERRVLDGLEARCRPTKLARLWKRLNPLRR